MQPRLADAYFAAPGVCTLCGCAQRELPSPTPQPLLERLVDLQMSFMPNQALDAGFLPEPAVFCESCIVELGRMVGMCTPAEGEVLRFNASALHEVNQRLGNRVTDLEMAISALRRADYRDSDGAAHAATFAAAHPGESEVLWTDDRHEGEPDDRPDRPGISDADRALARRPDGRSVGGPGERNAAGDATRAKPRGSASGGTGTRARTGAGRRTST